MFKTNSFKFIILLAISLGLSACSQESSENIVQWPSDKDCDLHHQSCTAKMGDSKVSLKISPHPIPIARPLGIEVELENLKDVSNIELDISGVNMYMGFNRITLKRTSENRYIGTSMLAFCTTKNMLWQVTLMIHKKDGEQIQIPYNLKTTNKL